MTCNHKRKFICFSLYIPIFIGLMTMSGCATLDKNECLNADWRTIGYEDGTRGYSGAHIANHRKACAKYNVTPDLDQYEEGRQMGLREYCTPGNGYRLGASGKQYHNTCPADLEPAFRQAMQAGHDLYVLEKDVREQRRTLEKAYKDLDALEIDIVGTETELIKPKVSPHRRKELLDELRILENQRDLLLADIRQMERLLDRMERKASRVREQSPYN